MEKKTLDLLFQFILHLAICQHLKVESQTLAPNLSLGIEKYSWLVHQCLSRGLMYLYTVFKAIGHFR